MTTNPWWTGAIIVRRAHDFWSIDEFDHEGQPISGMGGNDSPPSIDRLIKNASWPNDVMPLAKLRLRSSPTTAPLRKGLCRFSR